MMNNTVALRLLVGNRKTTNSIRLSTMNNTTCKSTLWVQEVALQVLVGNRKCTNSIKFSKMSNTDKYCMLSREVVGIESESGLVLVLLLEVEVVEAALRG